MTRKKVTLAFIANDAARKATFKKRRKGLLKKVDELSTLCGVDACAIIYSPYESQPEVWPSPLGAQRVLAHFQRMPEMEQSKKMVNQESFLQQRIQKSQDQVKKQQKDNREKEISHVLYQGLVGKRLNHLNLWDFNDLGWMIDQKIKDINYQIGVLRKGASSSSAPVPSAPNDGAPWAGGSMLNVRYEEKPVAAPMFDPNAESSLQRQWLVDMLNSTGQMGGPQIGGADETMRFGDINNNIGNNDDNNNNGANLWSNAFFPWDK